MENKISFSIIVPTYNRANLIGKTIESLLDQKHNSFEIIVIDDGSSDNTKEIIEKINSTKIKYYQIENSERGFARNYGARLAKGDYINFFDSDDMALTNHLLVADQTILNTNYPEVFHLNYAFLNTNGNISKNNNKEILEANKKLISGNILSCNGVFIKKDIALRFPFNESRNLSVSEDWDLWLRLSARYKIQMLPTITSYIVNHQGRSVMSFNEEKLLARTNELINSLSNDQVFMSVYPNSLIKIKAHMLSYMSLHAVLCGYKKKAFYYLMYAIKINYLEIFTKRFVAIITHLIKVK
jgi:glycosyltransferase involved in cell wall biosynthesis